MLKSVFSLSAFLILPVAIFAPKGVAVLFGLSALSAFVIALSHKEKARILHGQGTLLAAAFAVLSLASALWSITPEASFQKALVLLLFLTGGLVLLFFASRLEGAARQAFETSLIFGGTVGFTAMGIEIAFGSPLISLLWKIKGWPPQAPSALLGAINQGAAIAAIFLLPWTVTLWRHKGTAWAGCGFIIGAAMLAFCDADSHKAALAVGVLAALASFIGGRFVIRGVSALLVAGVLAGPWLVTALPDPLEADNKAALLSHSSQHRLVIWQTTVKHISARPLLGSGFDTARAFYGPDEKVSFSFGGQGDDKKWSNRFEPIPLHPHNGVLQVWLELGVLGAAVLAGGLFFLVQRLAEVGNNFQRSLIFGSFITGLIIFSVSYGAWQSWWMGAVWLMIAFGAACCKEKPNE